MVASQSVVYVHAYVREQDRDIVNRLLGFFNEIGQEKGLTRLEPVLDLGRLERLALQYTDNFRDALRREKFEGLGLWSEWESSQDVDLFFKGQKHRGFVEYAKTTFDRARYEVVQLVDGQTTTKKFP